ncbi:MAG: hypothetical protein E6J75_02000 [Deltaproteobacteria bacterium]|nr:MAG: hypothetical protein E6J75_02000 [Deltaproteobacteria bacterium]
MELRLANAGSDLDYGWTGTFHNFGFTGGSALKLCLTQCDTRTNPLCGACGPTGLGSINTATFGPPLPILAANVPLCVVNRFVPGEAVTGTADIEKGDLNITVGLLSDIFVTTPGEVCPRCTDGTCTSGANTGKTCTVDGTVTVAQADGDKSYLLSRDCPPSAAGSQFAGTVSVRLPLTSGKSVCNGPRPCVAQPGDPSTGVPVQDNQCGGSFCNARCAARACISTSADGQCIDANGGVSELCCAGDTTKPCFPTAFAPVGFMGSIERTGVARPPTPGWPDPTYPKSGGATLVATFCEPANTSGLTNTTAGLPGPGALTLPVEQTWQMP